MTLKLYNTRTRQLEDFKSINDKHVALYTCGPTVYSYLHIGNWASYIYWDILVRALKANGYQPERVMNITDVGHLVSDEDDGEDKMQKGARREGKTAWEVAKFYGDDFLSGMVKLGLVTPEHITKATDFIDEQLDLVRVLKNKGYTYRISDGIYFDTAKFPTYADFAGLDLTSQQAGARVTFNEEKRNASDFALWKFSPEDEQRDMEWETPADLLEDGSWNVEDGESQSQNSNSQIPIAKFQRMGFPGWHLECSAMAMKILGSTLDIHTGGIDHIPVHHTNEIAQSESASGQRFSNFWIHSNHLKVGGTKISKSLGNGYTLQDLDERGFSPLDYRMFVLQTHYQSEGNFTFENLEAARNRLNHWRQIAALRWQTHDTLVSEEAKLRSDKTPRIHTTPQAIVEAVNNNLGTPQALTVIDQVFSELESTPHGYIYQQSLNELLQKINEVLGIDLMTSTPDIDDESKQLIIERTRARENKDWAKSDEIRDQLLQKNITVRDTANGSIWSYSN